eukprot:6174497-Pleurochrysis_carterae.AAC.1
MQPFDRTYSSLPVYNLLGKTRAADFGTWTLYGVSYLSESGLPYEYDLCVGNYQGLNSRQIVNVEAVEHGHIIFTRTELMDDSDALNG